MGRDGIDTQPCRVGLTGGIGTGKSTVSRMFAELGVPVIDTDVIAREIVEPGQAAHAEIMDAFGRDVVARDGQLRRDVLRTLIFADPQKRRRLESILHPRIATTVSERVAALRTPYCIIVIPLLLERSATRVDRIVVVDADPAEQVRRVVARDDLTEAEVEAIMRTQAARSERLAAADDVIDNNGDLKHLNRQVAALHDRILKSCSQSRSA
jgi:dephospho-CoA kinase